MRGRIALQNNFVRKPTTSACFISRQLLECAGVLASLLRAWLNCQDHVGVTFAETALTPERIKVEPIVRRQTRIMLQPRDVEIHPRLDQIGRASCRERVKNSVGDGAVKRKKKRLID